MKPDVCLGVLGSVVFKSLYRCLHFGNVCKL